MGILGLLRMGVTDAGLAHLKGLTGMQTLYLDSTKVTDAGLECTPPRRRYMLRQELHDLCTTFLVANEARETSHRRGDTCLD